MQNEHAISAVSLADWDAIAAANAAATVGSTAALHQIDLIRPDTALINGRAVQSMRRAGLTDDWKATERNNRTPDNSGGGARELARRAKQRERKDARLAKAAARYAESAA